MAVSCSGMFTVAASCGAGAGEGVIDAVTGWAPQSVVLRVAKTGSETFPSASVTWPETW